MSAVDDIAILDSDVEADFSYVSHSHSKLADRVLRSSPSNSTRSLKRRDSSPSTNMGSSSNGSLSSKHSGNKRDSMALFDDQDASLLDPRRFTPTLHASLVSEILSLRRELESRNHVIEDLETSLDDARDTAETMSKSMADLTRENRTLKRQMSLVEGGTFSAVEELMRERDNAQENVNDLRKRMEQANQRIKAQEEDHDKSQKFWEQDQLKWQTERRELETRIHITEGRLKIVLSELMTHHNQTTESRPSSSGTNDSHNDNRTITPGSRTPSVKSGRTSPQSLRRASIDSYDQRTVRFSIDSMNGNNFNDMNLADELALDGDDCFENNNRPDSCSFHYDGGAGGVSGGGLARSSSLMSKRGSLRWNALRCSLDMTRRMESPDLAEKLHNIDSILGNDQTLASPGSEYKDAAVQFTPPPSPSASLSSRSSGKKVDEDVSRPTCTYKDAGVQFTPPPSPPPSASGLDHLDEDETRRSHYTDSGVQPDPVIETDGAPDEGPEHSPLDDDSQPAESLPEFVPTVSSSCQTADDLLEDLLKSREALTQPQEKPPVISTGSVAVQTDEVSLESLDDDDLASRDLEKVPFEIPLIAIHPPGSNPPTPRSSVVLPPHTRNASCQVEASEFENTQSAATQTDEIRIDQRKVKLPQGLLPSPIPYYPTEVLSSPPATPLPPPKSPRRKLFQLIRRGELPALATPASSKSSDDGDGSPKKYKSDVSNGSPTMEGETSSQTDYDSLVKSEDSTPIAKLSDHQAHQLEKLDEEDNEEDEVLSRASFVSTMPTGTLRRTATLTKSSKKPTRSLNGDSLSDSHAHDSPPSSPASRTGKTAELPYPVPVRGSSRNRIGTSNADGGFGANREGGSALPFDAAADETPGWAVPSRTDASTIESPARRFEGTRTPVARAKLKEPMKRVRAHAAPKATKTPSVRTRSPAMERSPTPPSLPDNSHASSPNLQNKQSSGHLQSSTTDPNNHRTSVVDAIAQTMVGEWMWKYVRRRKSFTVSEHRDNASKYGEEGGSGSRHKRWVWLAPYERAVMWSSKQPTSGSALLGKSGRKLTVQSVLDVKDENPLPRGASPENHFNRSIVILTPERALKFTALTPERHHIWLTALSFLSHPAVGMNNLAAIPPIPQDELHSAPTPALRRNPIRDSIRVAKGKRRFGKLTGGGRAAIASNDAGEDVGSLTAVEDAASPPCIPRFGKHNRKRSITGPKLSRVGMLRSLSANTLTSQAQGSTAASPAISSSFASRSTTPVDPILESESSAMVVSGNPKHDLEDPFFDAVRNGTVRMEAFVEKRPSTSDDRAHTRERDRRKLDMVVWTAKTDFFSEDDPESRPQLRG